MTVFNRVLNQVQSGSSSSQQQLRNSGMSYLWSFVRQHHLTVLNLDLKPIFLRSIFIVCNLVYFILTVMYFRFFLNI